MKIPQDKRQRTYELTYLIPAGLTSEEAKAITDQVDKLIKKHKGKVIESTDWGTKPLAYTIKIHGKKHNQAAYIHQKIEFETSQVQPFTNELKINQEILRQLLVLEEDVDFALDNESEDNLESEEADASEDAEEESKEI